MNYKGILLFLFISAISLAGFILFKTKENSSKYLSFTSKNNNYLKNNFNCNFRQLDLNKTTYIYNETTHGSESIREIEYCIIKKLIERKKLDFLIFEIDYTSVLAIRRFLDGSFSEEKLKKYLLRNTISASNSFFKLLEFIKMNKNDLKIFASDSLYHSIMIKYINDQSKKLKNNNCIKITEKITLKELEKCYKKLIHKYGDNYDTVVEDYYYLIQSKKMLLIDFKKVNPFSVSEKEKLLFIASNQKKLLLTAPNREKLIQILVEKLVKKYGKRFFLSGHTGHFGTLYEESSFENTLNYLYNNNIIKKDKSFEITAIVCQGQAKKLSTSSFFGSIEGNIFQTVDLPPLQVNSLDHKLCNESNEKFDKVRSSGLIPESESYSGFNPNNSVNLFFTIQNSKASEITK